MYLNNMEENNKIARNFLWGGFILFSNCLLKEFPGYHIPSKMHSMIRIDLSLFRFIISTCISYYNALQSLSIHLGHYTINLL